MKYYSSKKLILPSSVKILKIYFLFFFKLFLVTNIFIKHIFKLINFCCFFIHKR